MPDCSLCFAEAVALLKMATRAVFLCHKYAVLFVLKEIRGMPLGFLWLMVFNHILFFAAIITLHTFITISSGKTSFQFLLQIPLNL